MDELIKIAEQYGTPTVVATALVFLWVKFRLSKSIEHEYAKKLEKHSTDLNHASELVLKDVEAKANERAIKLTKIFDKQAEVILKIYSDLYNLQQAFHDSFSSKSLDETQLRTMIIEFNTYFHHNKPYLPNETANKVEAFLRSLIGSGFFVHSVAHSERISKFQADNTDKQFNTLFKDVPSLFESLEDDFRSLLGIRNANEK